MKNKKKKKKRRIDKLNVTRKKKKNWKRRKKWVYIANTAETRKHSSFQCPVKHFTRIFYSSFHSSIHPLSSSTFFIPFLFFFFFNLSRSFNWENTIDRRHHVASNCHIPICIYTNWSITLTPSSLFSFSPSLNYFISFDIIYRFRKNDPFAHELPFFFSFFF